MSNIITATFEDGETSAITTSQYQWETGQVLQFEGIDLPTTYRANISNSDHGTSNTQLGTAEYGVSIPDVYFTTGKYIYVWIVTTYGDDNAEIEYSVTIPIIKTSRPSDYEATDEEVTIINQAISALNNALDTYESTIEDVEAATEAAETATESAEAAVEEANVAIHKIDTLDFEINGNGELIVSYDDGDE